LYGFYLVKNKEVLNCALTFNSELCFDDERSFKNYRTIGCLNTQESVDCVFLKDCTNCQYCFASVNLRNKSYVFFNEQLSREEYLKRISQIDFGSFKEYQKLKRQALEHFNNYSAKAIYQRLTQNCTGTYLNESKNCQECYEVAHAEDCKYCMLIKKRV
jgi:hypothetical protein